MLKEIMTCQKCGLCNNQKPLLDKRLKCDVFWLGLSAKRVENIEINTPLEGDTNSGKLIDKIEQKLNAKCYKSNLVKCLPLNDKNKLRYPTLTEMNKCFDNLLIELATLKPKVVVLLGSKVAEFVEKRIKEIKKNIIDIKNIKFIKVAHPSYISVYKRKFQDEYVEDVTRLIITILND